MNRVQLACAVGLCASAVEAASQEWPARPIKILVGAAPGGVLLGDTPNVIFGRQGGYWPSRRDLTRGSFELAALAISRVIQALSFTVVGLLAV